MIMFADIAARAQRLANERGGDYSALSHAELCAFMVELDAALGAPRMMLPLPEQFIEGWLDIARRQLELALDLADGADPDIERVSTLAMALAYVRDAEEAYRAAIAAMDPDPA